VSGANSVWFQLAGVVHPRLRTALLPRELLNKQGLRCQIRFGSAVPVDQLLEDVGGRAAAAYLRARACALGNFGRRSNQPQSLRTRWRRSGPPLSPLASPADPLRMAREIEQLPASALLCSNGDLDVHCGHHDELPKVMREVGRLREITFRAAGEGTGKAVDLDQFDEYYHQLVVWNRDRREVVGAYRLALADETVRERGPGGLYSSTAFSFSPQFVKQIGQAIELGRSFVRPEYQKSFSPLMLLWRGIARFVLQRPHYSKFFGAVSISSRYRLASRELIVAYLSQAQQQSPLFPFVEARNPFHIAGEFAGDLDLLARDANLDRINALVADLEPDGCGLPVLFKQYLKLGAKSLAFGVDPLFGNCLDCLCVVDLMQTERRTLERYMGRDQAARFLELHGRPPSPPTPVAPGVASS
jgi:putative hemolysin